MGAANVDLSAVYTTLQNITNASASIEATKTSIIRKYQQLGVGWNDRKYRDLGNIVQECNRSLYTIQKILQQGKKFLEDLLKSLQEYEDVSFAQGQGSSGASSHHSTIRHLSTEEVNETWKQTISRIDIQIENYREALIARGVPEGTWLKKTLAEHRSRMLEQEGYNLDVASGHQHETTNRENAYNYPTAYPAFYDSLANDFRTYCLEGTNPNYSSGPQWQFNCQRCVPAYEMRRRGNDVTALPSTLGSDHLVHHPFDAWENPIVLSPSGTGRMEIEQVMREWGDGARAQISVIWDDAFGINGHIFVAEQRDGETHFMDPQRNLSDVSSDFDDVIIGQTQFCRIDNLRPSSFIQDCIEMEERS